MHLYQVYSCLVLFASKLKVGKLTGPFEASLSLEPTFLKAHPLQFINTIQYYFLYSLSSQQGKVQCPLLHAHKHLTSQIFFQQRRPPQ